MRAVLFLSVAVVIAPKYPGVIQLGKRLGEWGVERLAPLGMRDINEVIEIHNESDVACTTDDKIYTFDVKAHFDAGTISSIHSYVTHEGGISITKKDAITSYLGWVLNDLNEKLRPFKVQINMKLGTDVDEDYFSGMMIDKSCESVVHPLIQRNEMVKERLVDEYYDGVGIHLNVWSCPTHKRLDNIFTDIREVYSCGRVIGAIWSGVESTSADIQSAIVEAISGYRSPSGRLDEDIVDADELSRRLCPIANRCLGKDRSEIGQVVSGDGRVLYDVSAPFYL